MNIDLSQMKRVLVVRLDQIGDMVMGCQCHQKRVVLKSFLLE